ncbi:MAG: hypothetical protein ACYDHM_02405 [Acidiferrobacterales bacterium]
MTAMRKIIGPAVAGLFLQLAWSVPAAAIYAVPPGNTGTGTIQAVNHSRHTITVNGKTYHVSPKAAYGGVGGFRSLVPGMTVEFVGDGPLANRSTAVRVLVAAPDKSTKQ